MTGRQFRLIAGLWLATSVLAAAFTHSVGYRDGRAAAEAEAVAAKARHDGEMANMGLCEWPKAFARETHCPGY